MFVCPSLDLTHYFLLITLSLTKFALHFSLSKAPIDLALLTDLGTNIAGFDDISVSITITVWPQSDRETSLHALLFEKRLGNAHRAKQCHAPVEKGLRAHLKSIIKKAQEWSLFTLFTASLCKSSPQQS